MFVKKFDRPLRRQIKVAGEVVVVSVIDVKFIGFTGVVHLLFQSLGNKTGTEWSAVPWCNWIGPPISARYELAEIEFQNSGFSSGDPNSVTSLFLQLRARLGFPEGGVKVPRLQLFNRSGYEATTPAQITAAFISGSTTMLLTVTNPPIECPHMPILFGSASLYFFSEAVAFKTSIV